MTDYAWGHGAHFFVELFLHPETPEAQVRIDVQRIIIIIIMMMSSRRGRR